MTITPFDRDSVCFDVDVTYRERSAILTVVGDIDLLTAPRLEATLRRLLAAKQNRLVLDLSRVDFFDASALRVFVAAEHHTRMTNGRVDLVCPSAFARKVLRLTGLDETLTVHDDLGAAVAAQR